jgi:hypothetical protein
MPTTTGLIEESLRVSRTVEGRLREIPYDLDLV